MKVLAYIALAVFAMVSATAQIASQALCPPDCRPAFEKGAVVDAGVTMCCWHNGASWSYGVGPCADFDVEDLDHAECASETFTWTDGGNAQCTGEPPTAEGYECPLEPVSRTRHFGLYCGYIEDVVHCFYSEEEAAPTNTTVCRKCNPDS